MQNFDFQPNKTQIADLKHKLKIQSFWLQVEFAKRNVNRSNYDYFLFQFNPPSIRPSPSWIRSRPWVWKSTSPSWATTSSRPSSTSSTDQSRFDPEKSLTSSSTTRPRSWPRSTTWPASSSSPATKPGTKIIDYSIIKASLRALILGTVRNLFGAKVSKCNTTFVANTF